MQKYFSSATNIQPYWLSGLSSISFYDDVSNEVTDDDWRNMAVAVSQPSVACRFNRHPLEPIAYFGDTDLHIDNFVSKSNGYYRISGRKVYKKKILEDFLK